MDKQDSLQEKAPGHDLPRVPLHQIELPLPAASRPLLTIGEEGLEFRLEIRLEIARYYARNPVQRQLKRLLDFLLASTAAIIMSPLLLVIALLIKLDSPGPVLFLQQRVGKGGRFFTMYKFRSMYSNADAIRQTMNLPQRPDDPRDTKLKYDPRITRVGRLLRRFSLDELPQFFNVIFGDMAIVGPRPALASEAEKWEKASFRRLAVDQGCTCIWQVSGRSEVSFQEQMRMDTSYVRDWTLWMDLKLMMNTLWAMLTGRGAY